MGRFFKRYGVWGLYAVFLVLAVAFGGREGVLTTQGDPAWGKYALIAVFLAFLGYSLHATRHENFFKTLGQMNRSYWGRQVGMDLYISVALSLVLIWLVEGSVPVVLAWAVPVIFFANLAILPYIIVNYGVIVSLFAAQS